jgi:transcriptional regulator with XRE-family HTH domain
MAPRRRGPNKALRAAREDRGWTLAQVAEWVTTLVRKLGYALPPTTRQRVQRYEMAGVVPDFPRLDALCKLFGVSAGELGFPAPPAVLAGYDADQEVIATDRRTALKGLGAILAGPIIDPAIAPLRRLAEMSVSSAVVGCETLMQQLGYHYSAEPPDRLLSRLRELATFTDGAAELAPARYGAQLRSVAGWSSGLLANALFDAGDPAAADATIRLSLQYGEDLGDARLIAYARDRQAMMASERGDYAGALRYIEAGLHAAPASTAIRVRLLWERASLHARLQQRDQAAEDLRLTVAEHSQVPANELNEGSFGVSRITPARASGEVLARLGDDAAARAGQEQTITYYRGLAGADARPSRLAYMQLHAATSLRRLGEPEQAASVALQALQTPRMDWGLQQRLVGFGNELLAQHPQLPAARHYQEQVTALPAS